MAVGSAGSDVQFDDAFVIVPDGKPVDGSALVDILNSVYSAESVSLFRYLETWAPYTDARTIALRNAVRRMMRRSFEHSDVLAHLIGQVGGVTVAGAFSQSAGATNDTSWRFLLPRLIKAKRDMCARYELALQSIANLGGIDAEVPIRLNQLLDEDRRDLEELESWTVRLGASSSPGVV